MKSKLSKSVIKLNYQLLQGLKMDSWKHTAQNRYNFLQLSFFRQ